MKKVLIGIGVFVALVIVVMLGSWFGTQGARTQADRMLEFVKANDVEALGSVMHPNLIEIAPPAKLIHMARTWGLDEAQDVSWQKWSISTEGAEIEGAFTRADGKQQALYLKFVKLEGDWKVISFTTDSLARVTDPLALELPDSDEIAAMLAQVTRDFGEGVRSRSFTKLYESMSFAARSTLTPAELDESFAVFVENQIDISPAAALAPLLHAPAGIDPKGFLVIEGHYPSRPVQVHFNYTFSHEEGAWRLSALNVRTVAPENEPSAPTN